MQENWTFKSLKFVSWLLDGTFSHWRRTSMEFRKFISGYKFKFYLFYIDIYFKWICYSFRLEKNIKKKTTIYILEFLFGRKEENVKMKKKIELLVLKKTKLFIAILK